MQIVFVSACSDGFHRWWVMWFPVACHRAAIQGTSAELIANATAKLSGCLCGDSGTMLLSFAMVPVGIVKDPVGHL